MRSLLFVCLTVLTDLVGAQSSRSSGTELWIAYMENLSLMFNGPPYFEVVVSSEANTRGEVQLPQSGFAIPFTVEAGHDTVVRLPNNIYYPQGDEVVFNFGLRVVADDPVSVYTYHHRPYFTEATMALPIGELGTDHLVIAHTDDFGPSPSELVVMATQDATTIEITPSVLTAGFRSPGQPFTIALNAGQVFQLQAYSDLTGTRVRSVDGQKRLAVFAGARQASVDCTQGADNHLYEAIPPLTAWGRTYVAVPFKDRGGDPFRLLSATDGNQVAVGTASPIVLDRGRYTDVMLTEPTVIRASAPLAVGQFDQGQSCNPRPGDPAFLWNFPSDRHSQRITWSAITGYWPVPGDGTPEHFVNAVVQTADTVPPVFLDGVDISSAFLPVPNTVGTYSLQLGITDGEHRLVCDQGLWASAYGFGDYDAYAFALGYDGRSVHTGGMPTAGASVPTAYWSDAGEALPEAFLNAFSVTLFDASGRQVARWSPQQQATWPLLAEGLYTWMRYDHSDGPAVTGRLLIIAH